MQKRVLKSTKFRIAAIFASTLLLIGICGLSFFVATSNFHYPYSRISDFPGLDFQQDVHDASSFWIFISVDLESSDANRKVSDWLSTNHPKFFHNPSLELIPIIKNPIFDLSYNLRITVSTNRHPTIIYYGYVINLDFLP